MRLRDVALALLAVVAGVGAGGPEELERLRSLGRHFEAMKVAKGMADDPVALAYRATLLFEDDPDLRKLGFTIFDHAQAERLAKEALPKLKEGAATDGAAAHSLAGLYLHGLGVEQDEKAASHMYRDAAKLGHIRSMLKLAYLYAEGIVVERDHARAFAWSKRAAEGESPEALVNLGDAYLNGVGTPADSDNARECYERAALKGSVDGMYSAAKLATERIVDLAAENKPIEVLAAAKEAEKWYRMAADAGDREAMQAMSQLIRGSVDGPDLKAAYGWAVKSADTGLSSPLFTLACYLTEGLACKVDVKRADALFGEALAAAKSEGNDFVARNTEEVLATKGNRARIEAIRRINAWEHPGATAGRSKAAARRPAPFGQAPDLVLTDLVLNPSASGAFVSTEGRVGNPGVLPVRSAKVNVTYVDAAGRLIATSMAILTPSDVPPGGYATFKTFDTTNPAIYRVKVDFVGFAGKPLNWQDRSGKNAKP